MKKLAVITVSAMFALGAAQVASAANNGLTGDDKQNYSNSYANGHDKNNVPGTNMGIGNSFGTQKDPGAGGNAFGQSKPNGPFPGTDNNNGWHNIQKTTTP